MSKQTEIDELIQNIGQQAIRWKALQNVNKSRITKRWVSRNTVKIQALIDTACVEARKQMADYVVELIDAGYRIDTNVGSDNFKKMVKDKATNQEKSKGE